MIDSLLFQVRQQLREATDHVQSEDSSHSSGSEVTQVRVPGRGNAPCKAFWELSDTSFLSLLLLSFNFLLKMSLPQPSLPEAKTSFQICDELLENRINM